METQFSANRWYPIARSSAIRKKPISLTRLGQSLVVWRPKSGQITVMKAHCPHRGANLATGRVRKGCIECPYHGFRFNALGSCVEVPCEGHDFQIPKGLDVLTYPADEAHGLIWMWWGDLPPKDRTDWCTMLAEDVPVRWASCEFSWQGTLARVVEGLLDPHHVAFLHKWSSLGMAEARVDPFEATLDGDAIRAQGGIGKMKFSIIAKYPGCVSAHYGPKVVYAYATPIDTQNTWLSLQYDLRWNWLGPLRQIVTRILVSYERRFVLPEDEVVLRGITPVDSGQETNKLIGADRAIALWYKQYRQDISRKMIKK